MSEQKAPSEALRAAQTAAPDDQSDEGHKPDTSGDRLAFVSRILPRRISRRVLFDIALLVTSILVFGAIAVALGEDVNWDLLNYHYYDGYAALQGGRQDFVPAMLQTYFVPTLDILQYLLIAHLPPVAVGFILGGFQGINFWLVFQIASSLIHLSRAWLEWPLWFACAALGMYAPTSRAELGVTRGDLTLSVLVLAGLLLLLRISTREITGRAPVLLAYIAAGALLGFAAGSKYTLAPYALMAVVAFVAVPQVDGLRGRQERQRLKTLLSSGLHWLKTLAIVGSSALVGLFAGGGWWMLLLYRQFGNPFYPMYNTIFHSPYVVSYMSSLRPFPPQTWEQTVFTPFFFTRNTTYKTLETPFQDLSFAAIYILLGLTALALILGAPKIQGAISSLQMRFAIFFALSFVIWEAYFEVYRYLATLELLAPVMLYILAQWIFTDERVRVAVVLGGFVCLALTSYPHFWQRVPWGDRYFQVDAPALSDPAHTLVIMNTQQPYAYVIPSFPQEVVFANIEGNWKYVGSKLYFSIEHQAVVTHSGPIYFMSPDADPKRANAALAPYNLVMAPDSCAVIAYKGTKPNSWPLPIYFCQVQQATAAQPAPGASQVTK